ncbi:hypothetical protein N9381_07250 [Paracoccaceae bacterium]|nr:hypothetical protein [Paracoccaceae bacterium]
MSGDFKGVQLATVRAPTNWEPAGISIVISVFFAVAVAVALFGTLSVSFNRAPVTKALSSFVKNLNNPVVLGVRGARNTRQMPSHDEN